MVSSFSSIWFISLSQLLESVQHLLHSAEFAAILWLLGPWGKPRPALYTSSVHALFCRCACVVFALLCRGIVILADSNS